MKSLVQEACQHAKKNFLKMQKKSCITHASCYSFFMQANSIITDDFNTQIQSDEFASEYDAWLDEQEQKYWQEIDAKGN